MQGSLFYMSSTRMSPNWREIISAQSSITGRQEYLYSTNHSLNTTISSGTIVATGTNANLYTGHATVNTTQVQVSPTSHTLVNGLIVKTPSTNGAIVYVGLVGVTTSTGDILEPGESRGYPVNNTNLIYIISASSTTDIVSFEGN